MAHASIVIVSHSEKLGSGLLELLAQLTRGKVHLASASGLGPELGTDATRIVETLCHCPADSDIYVFFDLGSALLNCQMALDLVPDPVRDRISLVDAPLVEGAIAAAVAASVGSPRQQVIDSAMQARTTMKLPG